MLEYYRFKQIYELFSKGQIEDGKRNLMELQRRYVTVCDENTTFRAQLQEYEDILYLARNLFFDGKFYWLVTGSIKQGPFCPECYNSDGLLMRLAGESTERYCQVCRTHYAVTRKNLEQNEIAAAVPQERESETFAKPNTVHRHQKILPFRS